MDRKEKEMAATGRLFSGWRRVGRLVLMVGVIVSSATGSVSADTGQFAIRWNQGGPWEIKLGYGIDGSLMMLQQRQDLVNIWPWVWGVSWPTTETRPAPATGEIQGILLTNSIDRGTDPTAWEIAERVFEHCVGVAKIAAARPQFHLEVFIKVADTSTDYQLWGLNTNIAAVNVEAGGKLNCSLLTDP